MIGKSQIQLGAEQFISGMSSTDYATDGALGVNSNGLNPFVAPGAMYSLAGATDISTNVVDNIICSCEDSNATSPNNRYLLGDAAHYYSDNGTTISLATTGSATFIQGKADLSQFSGNLYASASGFLVKWTLPATINETYKTFADGSAHHPLITYINYLYFGDGNILCTLDGSGTVVTRLTLPPKEKIVALGIDPVTGLLMVSVQTVYDVSDNIPSLKAVYLYDGISAQYTRKILVDDLVTAFYNVEGTVFVGCGLTLGSWNGNGVTFLRILKNATYDNKDLLYKHHFSNTNRILHVIDGYNVLSYGSVTVGKKGFFYTAGNIGGTFNHLTCIFPRGSTANTGQRLGIAYANTGPVYKVYSSDFGSTATGGGTMYFNNIYFPRPVEIRSVRIITTGITTAGGGGVGGFTFLDQDSISPTGLGFVVPSPLAPNSGSPQAMFEFDYTSVKLQSIQPRVSFSGQGFGVVRIIIYYDVVE